MLPIAPTPGLMRGSNEPAPAVSHSLERLASSLRHSGMGPAPAVYGLQFEERVKAAELAKQVRDSSDAVTEARIAREGLAQVGGLLEQARRVAFRSIRSKSKRERDEDSAAFSETLTSLNEIAALVVLPPMNLSTPGAAAEAIDKLDRLATEVADTSARLELAQKNRLADNGNLLREEVAIWLEATTPIRDRGLALELARHATEGLEAEPNARILSGHREAARVLEVLLERKR